jgi:hypothetical protein
MQAYWRYILPGVLGLMCRAVYAATCTVLASSGRFVSPLNGGWDSIARLLRAHPYRVVARSRCVRG